MIEPFFIEDNNSQLFFTYHPASGTVEHDFAVILCYPFGQEYIRCHRTYKFLAESLASRGIHALRFDYHGCGDSSGDLQAVSIEDWLGNIHLAVGEVRDSICVRQVYLFGMRFGATLACLYSSTHKVNGLILWEPVFDGSFYIQQLKKMEKDFLRGSFAKAKNKNGFECLGFSIPRHLLTEMTKIRLTAKSLKSTQNILLISEAKDEPDFIDLENLEFREAVNPGIWIKSQEDFNKAIVPQQDINNILEWIIK